MVKLISHRGNMKGKNPDRENHPDYIMEALNKGYHVEVDVHYKDGDLYLGHNEPKYKVRQNLLRFNRIICHAKDKEALQVMLESGEIHCFWHDGDDYTLTSDGLVWVHPTKELLPESVCVLPENPDSKLKGIEDCYAICSDYIEEFSGEKPIGDVLRRLKSSFEKSESNA